MSQLRQSVQETLRRRRRGRGLAGEYLRGRHSALAVQRGIGGSSDQLVTSFSSKSELALNLSTDHKYLTFAGYVAAIDQLDASNANTPGAIDPTNPVG